MKRGFTTTELLVTICILAILLGIAVPAIKSITGSFEDVGYLGLVSLILDAGRQWCLFWKQ